MLECTKLAGVFELVLALGNTLNKKKTNGFRVQSLLKLVETKSNKAKVQQQLCIVTASAHSDHAFSLQITMLHYLASVVESRMEHLIDFPDELPTIEEASGISVENVASTFQAHIPYHITCCEYVPGTIMSHSCHISHRHMAKCAMRNNPYADMGIVVTWLVHSRHCSLLYTTRLLGVAW